jgi:hypothetical protein
MSAIISEKEYRAMFRSFVDAVLKVKRELASD